MSTIGGVFVKLFKKNGICAYTSGSAAGIGLLGTAKININK
jgi:hypothetical protein